MTIDIFSAFIIGLLGSSHCLVMCGGITTMLTTAIKEPSPQRNTSMKGDIPIQVTTKSHCSPHTSQLNFIFLYHLGRITSYAFIGAIVGFTGSIAAKNIGIPFAGLRLIAATFLILLGLYIGNWLLLLNKVELLGKHLWRYLSPLTKHAIPVNTPKKALILGGLWGWLPCGLVYSTLTWALASGSALTGLFIMFFFGLGTLPALIALSLGFNTIKKLLANNIFRKIMATSLITYGIYSFIIAYRAMF